MIVLENAELDNAARGAIWGAFANSGQCCASVERCYVHESIAPQFVERLVTETKKLKQNTGLKDDTDIGAMSSERQLQIVADHVNDAVNQGAKALTGGRRPPQLSGLFFEPTVLIDVDHRMTVTREETFGPLLPVMTFKTDDEAVELANASGFGLTASVWTKDIARGRRLAERIEAGTVMVNEVVYTHGVAQTPWGGVKQSGFGRTHGRPGLLEMVSAQHITSIVVIISSRSLVVPLLSLAGRLFRGFAKRFTTGSIFPAVLLLPQMIRRLFERRHGIGFV